jgi:RNA-binding protein Nova
MESTNTVIKFSPGRELYPGTNDRVCLITGTIIDICEALRLIFATMMQSTHAKSDDLAESMKHFKMIVSNIASGMVIGKSGHTIKSIQLECGVKMQITNKDENALPERTLTVDGETDAILKAIEKILSHTTDDPDAGKWRRLVAYSNYSISPSQSATMSSSSSHGLSSGKSGHGAPSSLAHSAYGASSSDPTAAFMSLIAQHQQQQQQHQHQAYSAYSHMPSHGSSGGSSFNQALMSYAYAQSLLNNSSYYNQFQPVMVDGVNLTVPGATVSTYEIAIPEVMVSAIAGSDNKLLADLMQTTGARVQLSGKGEFIPGTYNRKMTVTGPILSVQSAHMIIMQKLLKEQESYQKHGML